MALRSGFFNAMRTAAGTYDRTYKAEDYCENLATIISNGVVRSVDDDFRPTAADMTVTIGAGRAWINGHWIKNDIAYTFAPTTAPTGYGRYDAIFLRLNLDTSLRNVTLEYVQGEASANPVAPTLIRTEDTYDLCLAQIYVGPNATAVSVIDTRSNQDLCGWVYSTGGDNSFFTSLDNQFSVWFEDVKDTVATTTTEIEYKQLTVLSEESNTVQITIPQYDADQQQKINVYVNGLIATPEDYTVQGTIILFNSILITGTEILVSVVVSKDGSGIAGMVAEVTELQDKVAALENGLIGTSYTYICNGYDDNVKLSEIAQTWLEGGTDYSSIKVNVYGELGVSAPFAGDGSATAPYRWFSLGSGSTKSRRIIFDFSGCSQINVECQTGTSNFLFFGFEVNMIGANVVATGDATIYGFTTAANTTANVENSRFFITATNGFLARSGHFKNCYVNLTISGGNSYVFYPASASLLRVECGEYYAYAPSTYNSAIVAVEASGTDAVAITSEINCPTVAKSGYSQGYSIYCLSRSAKCSFTDTISALPYSAEGQNNRGYIVTNKPGFW